MTVDTFYPNAPVISVAIRILILEVILQLVSGATIFSSRLFQRILAIPATYGRPKNVLTTLRMAIYTPTRLIQRATDSRNAFQAGILEGQETRVYGCMLIWIDDLLVYAKDLKELFASNGKDF